MRGLAQPGTALRDTIFRTDVLTICQLAPSSALELDWTGFDALSQAHVIQQVSKDLKRSARDGRWEQALEASICLRALLRSIGVEPTTFPYLTLLRALILVEVDQPEQAAEELRGLQLRFTSDASLALAVGVAYRRAGAPQRSLAALQAALELEPEHEQVKLELLRTSLDLPTKARVGLIGLSSPRLLDPEHTDLRLWHALHALDAGEVAPTLDELERCWAGIAPRVLSLLLTAVLERDFDLCFGRIVEAMIDSGRDDLGEVIHEAGRQALLRKQIPLATACFERALKIGEPSLRLQAEAAAAFSWASEPRLAARAQDLAQRIVAAPRGRVDADGLFARGLAFTILGRWREAEGIRSALPEDLPRFGELLPAQNGSRRLRRANGSPG